MEKAEARKNGLNRRRELTEAERNDFNASIAAKVMDAVSSAQGIGCYVSFRQEVSDLQTLWGRTMGEWRKKRKE